MNKTLKRRKPTPYPHQRLQCHPGAHKKSIRSSSCITTTSLSKIKQASPQINTIEDLYKQHNCPLTDGDMCVLRKSPPAVQNILLRDFRPVQPLGWKKKPNEWLSNQDILYVLHQYEEAFPYFHCIGPSPIDFDTIIQNQCVLEELCKFSIDAETKAGKTDVAIVFNLDKHNEPGSHWTSLYVDVPACIMYYFDSAKNDVPQEILTFHKRVAPHFEFLSNTIMHQQSNTECGMYSLYFIIELLNQSSVRRRSFFLRRFNNSARKITDKTVERFRNIYFTPL